LIKYILKRLLYALITLWLLSSLTFFMMRMLPGDPFIGERVRSPITMENLAKKYGLDKPVSEQYKIYIQNLAKGDFGISIHYNRPVGGIIKQAFPYSFELGMRSMIFAVSIGISLGAIAAIRRGTKWDTTSTLISVIGVSVPGFILGTVLQFIFALQLNNLLSSIFPGTKFLPVQGWTTELHKILPSLALSVGTLAMISRLMRSSTLDVMTSDYIKTAKSKGLSERVIIWRHVLRNAILPVITVLGPIAAALLTGTFIVEQIFNVPGLGKFFVQSINIQDYTMIAGTTFFYGAFLVVASLAVDIAYAFIDPRIRLGGGEF